MPRSHPPTLLTLAGRTLREDIALARGEKVLAAVSGGPDSMALLDVLSRLRPRLGIELCAHGVDHGLRAEAHAELDLAEEHARRLGVEFTRTELRLAPGGNLQARAREARYAALEAEARRSGSGLLATAHQADDRAETVLLRLLRGAGPRGLSVLPAREGPRIRPLIRARRADVLAHLARHRVPFASDPSNVDPRFLRARVRHELLPLLSDLSPGIVAHLNALADALASGSQDSALEQSAKEQGLTLGRAHRLALSRALRLGNPETTVRLPGGVQARIDPETGGLVVDLAAPRLRR